VGFEDLGDDFGGSGFTRSNGADDSNVMKFFSCHRLIIQDEIDFCHQLLYIV